MSNHLRNVLTVINDIKIPQSANTIDVDGYLATIVSTADYSPFGVQLDERTESAESYRYGYQGSEKDDEVKGSGNSYTTEFRMLDPRLGRWLSIDPKATAWDSPYASMENSPIYINDPLGDTVRHATIFDKISTSIGRIFNKDFREKYNTLDSEIDVYTFSRSRKSNYKLFDAPSVETRCRTNDNGVIYSENSIHYNKAFGDKELLLGGNISNPILRFLVVDLTVNIPFQAAGMALKAPFALASGAIIGFRNLFRSDGNKLGWGWGNRVETFGGLNVFSFGFGNYNKYSIFGVELTKLWGSRGPKIDPSDEMHDGLFGIRVGAGRKRPVQFIDIGQRVTFNGYQYYGNL